MISLFARLLLLLGPLTLGVAGWYGLRAYDAPGPLAQPLQLVVPRGNTEAIAATLSRAGVIGDPRLFALSAWLTRADGALRAGEYAFPANVSIEGVLDVLRHARPVARMLTIPEGLTGAQIAALLARAEGLEGEAVVPAEGAILPDTYAYRWGEDRGAVLRRAEVAMTTALAELWEQRAAELPLASPREAVILASIVERETALAAERPRIAAVFVNRLRRGMPLQSDPTVAYAAGAPDRPPTRADLERDSPYNTYRVRGLPPGPIAAPGRAAIQAVLQPAASDALFFVADGQGGHAFARTLEEHNRNVARWRARNQ